MRYDELVVTSKDSSDVASRRSQIATAQKYYAFHYVQDLSQFQLVGGGYGSQQYPYKVQQIEASGDHLTVAELNSHVPIHVRLGDASNPWIRVKQGDVIQREFTKLWVTVLDSSFAVVFVPTVHAYAEAVFYASRGPFLDRKSFDEFDFARDIQTRQMVLVAATMTDIFGGAGTGQFTTGRHGGTLRIQNVGAASVDVGYFTDGSNNFQPVNQGWTIPSGAIPYYTDFRFRHQINSPLYRFGAKSAGGTTIQVMFSPEVDLTNPDGNLAGANGYVDLTP